MKQRYGHPEFYKLLKDMADLHSRKNRNYAKDDSPLSNLRLSEEFDIPAWKGVLIRMSDKYSRICELAKGKPDLVNEAMEDTLMDLSVYSLLCIILRREIKKAPYKNKIK